MPTHEKKESQHQNSEFRTSNQQSAGLFPAIFGKGPRQKLGKMIDLTSKLGEIDGIEHNKGKNISSKSSYFRLYNAKHTTKAQVFKYHSDMGYCFS